MQQIEEYLGEEDFEAHKEGNPGSFWDRFVKKVEHFLESPYWILFIIILVAILSFLLGRISKIGENKEPVRVVNNSNTSINNPPSPPYIKGGTEKETSASVTQSDQAAAVVNSTTEEKVEVVGSKNGTKYHLPTCPGAKQISEKNLIKFESIEEARSRGYTPASNCKGLQ